MKYEIINKIFDLHDKTVILTGAAGRLGSRFAHVLSDAGANVILVDLVENDNKKLENTLKQKFKTKPLALKADITSESEVKSMVKDVVKKYKKIDILINNAHIVPRKDSRLDSTFEKFPLEIWDKMVTENLRGLFFCCREVGKVMLKQPGGVIVNISSIYGIVGPDQRIYGNSKLNSSASYSVFKGGLVNLTRYLAAYWEGKNIRVNTLTIGGVFDKKMHSNTSFEKNYSKKTILGRMANKEDLDGPLLLLASNASSYMTGSNVIVDGGWSAW